MSQKRIRTLHFTFFLYSRDVRPPRPALSPMANGHSEGDDPFSNQVTLCQQLTNKNTLNTPLQSVSPADAYNNEDAFGNFSNKQSGVSSLKPTIIVSFLLFSVLFCFQAPFDPFNNFSSSSGFVSGTSSAFTTPNNDPFAAFGAAFPSQFVSFVFFLFWS